MEENDKKNLKIDYDLWYIVDEGPFVSMINDSSSNKGVCVLSPKTTNGLDKNDKKNLGLNALT